ncbi:EMC3/TMCO1 family protein [Lacicoccus qingdaonensis]|uniref:Uncharacterized protein n=1 Tax=Lacicoccus qingdaonensis TaxID=576118 RepID=A0A1G9F1E4_9BACL|nr:hypothetical protein [Salinicoccus qingdaonensis]SDK82083.1 hypothetical protein SAMN05216216_11078 [Salinicoccus qingdaonensis]
MIVEIISALMFFIALTLINVSVIYKYRRKIKWFFNEVYNKSLKRSTPLQKEIKAEQKEIKRLEQHKADMKELERLKEQREKLFEETRKFKGVDPMPHLKAIEKMNSPEETDTFIYESTTGSISQCPECETENIASAISYGVLLDRYHNTCLDCNHKWMAETKILEDK